MQTYSKMAELHALLSFVWDYTYGLSCQMALFGKQC